MSFAAAFAGLTAAKQGLPASRRLS